MNIRCKFGAINKFHLIFTAPLFFSSQYNFSPVLISLGPCHSPHHKKKLSVGYLPSYMNRSKFLHFLLLIEKLLFLVRLSPKRSDHGNQNPIRIRIQRSDFGYPYLYPYLYLISVSDSVFRIPISPLRQRVSDLPSAAARRRGARDRSDR